jgi:hypothetical protein
LSSSLDEARFAKYPQVLGHSGLANRKLRAEVAGSLFTFGQHFDDAAATRVRKGRESFHRNKNNL